MPRIRGKRRERHRARLFLLIEESEVVRVDDIYTMRFIDVSVPIVVTHCRPCLNHIKECLVPDEYKSMECPGHLVKGAFLDTTRRTIGYMCPLRKETP